MKEHRIILSKEEVFDLSSRLKILNTTYLRDVYTGTKRIRTDSDGTTEKDYKTPVNGTIHKFVSKCELGEIKDIWLEYKWTKDKQRFGIEFESEIPEIYSKRENVPGWDILR